MEVFRDRILNFAGSLTSFLLLAVGFTDAAANQRLAALYSNLFVFVGILAILVCVFGGKK